MDVPGVKCSAKHLRLLGSLLCVVVQVTYPPVAATCQDKAEGGSSRQGRGRLIKTRQREVHQDIARGGSSRQGRGRRMQGRSGSISRCKALSWLKCTRRAGNRSNASHVESGVESSMVKHGVNAGIGRVDPCLRQVRGAAGSLSRSRRSCCPGTVNVAACRPA